MTAMHESKTEQIFVKVTDGIDVYHWVVSYAEAKKGTLAIQADFYEDWQVLQKYGDSFKFQDIEQDLYDFVRNYFKNMYYDVTLTQDIDERKTWMAHANAPH